MFTHSCSLNSEAEFSECFVWRCWENIITKLNILYIHGKEQGEMAVFTDYLRHTQLEDLLSGTIFQASDI